MNKGMKIGEKIKMRILYNLFIYSYYIWCCKKCSINAVNFTALGNYGRGNENKVGYIS